MCVVSHEEKSASVQGCSSEIRIARGAKPEIDKNQGILSHHPHATPNGYIY
jgi:hypothetical protein